MARILPKIMDTLHLFQQNHTICSFRYGKTMPRCFKTRSTVSTVA